MIKKFYRMLSLLLAFTIMTGMLTVGTSAASGTVAVSLTGIKDYAKAYEVLELVNQKRKSAGVNALTMDKDLLECAMQRAAECNVYVTSTNEYNVRPNGDKCYSAYDDFKLPGHACAENINYSFDSASDVMDDWASDKNCLSNITDSEFTTIGIGCFYQEDGTVCWTQLFNDASTASASNLGTISASMKVDVKPANLGEMSMSLSSSNLKADERAKISTSIKNIGLDNQISFVPDASCLTYKTSNSAVVSVTSDGYVIGKNSGTATITASVPETDKVTASANVTVKSDADPNPQPDPDPKPQPTEKVNNTITASDISKNASTTAQSFSIDASAKGNAALSYSSNSTDITVDKSGQVTIAANYVGKATITITAAETESYKKTSKEITVQAVAINNKITASNFTKTTKTSSQTFKIGAKAKGSAKLSYSSNTKNVTVDKNGKVTIAKNYVGKATITITASKSGIYKKTVKKITVTVNPASVKLSSVKSTKKACLTVAWKKNSKVSGYQIQYSTDKAFKKKVSTATVKKASSTKKTLTKLSKGKKYYVRIRTYKTVSKKNYYSSWSSAKNTTVKK